jgi:choline kinase
MCWYAFVQCGASSLSSEILRVDRQNTEPRWQFSLNISKDGTKLNVQVTGFKRQLNNQTSKDRTKPTVEQTDFKGQNQVDNSAYRFQYFNISNDWTKLTVELTDWHLTDFKRQNPVKVDWLPIFCWRHPRSLPDCS